MEVSLVCFETSDVRNGGFPSISANNNVTVISDSSPPGQAGKQSGSYEVTATPYGEHGGQMHDTGPR